MTHHDSAAEHAQQVVDPQPATGNRLTFPHILRRSLVHRRARSISALIALTVSAAVGTALLTLYADLDAKLHHEFRNFGANIVLTASNGSGFPDNAIARIHTAVGEDALIAPFSYAVATTDRGTPVVVAGTDFDAARRLNSWWQVDAWPTQPDSALLGQRAAQFITNQHAVTLTFSSKPITLQGSGHLRTGGDEDSRIYMPLAAFTRWTGQSPSVLEVQVPGNEARINNALASLHREFPDAQVQPIRQLIEGESRIVDRTHALMYAAVLLIALTVGVSVLATLSASILERRRDFALMKALGGSHLHLMALFLVEALILALAGVAAGFIIGSAAAYAISELNFHTATLPHPSVLPFIFLLNLSIATAAALFPARVLRTLQPAALLKGE
jgi:putative ABC transport system permease protein